MTRWIDPSPVQVPASFKTLNLPPLLFQTLVRRGLTDLASVQAFLDPEAYIPTPASALPGMQAAIERLILATRKSEAICVWGDFDVDGQTATTVLVETLGALGAKVSFHIPIRAVESHGIRLPQLTEVIERGAKLILTCDTGITAHEAVDFARSRGVDFVITDHHDLGETLPDAVAVINPKLLPEGHPLSTLAGVGVAYKLAEALLERGGPSSDDHELGPESMLDLVALGLIADIALLRGDARYLVQGGLETLRSTRRLGLKTIYELANLEASTLNENSVGFALGPRLNALGRLGDANPAVDLLTTRNPARARVLAAQIEGLNAQRKLLTEQVTQAAEAQLRADPSLLEQPVIVLGYATWPGGVVGIVASRLVERYHKPAILFTTPEDGPARGSARSIEGLHITKAIAAQKDLLLDFGGHPMAAGLSLEKDNLPAFRKALGRTVERLLAEANIQEETLQIDAWLTLEKLSFELADSIEQLAPFGAGNPALTIATPDLGIIKTTPIGKSREHLKFTVQDEAGCQQEVLWWNAGAEELPDGKFDLAYSLRAGSFRGERQLNLECIELRLPEAKPVEIQKPGIEIRDFRKQAEKLESLEAGTVVWAEGAERGKGQSRFELHEADALAIWSIPPSPVELRTALGIVKPRVVYLLAIAPEAESPEAFLERLAGLCKYALHQRKGQVRLSELAAATAQRELTIRLGLEWLAAGGHLIIEIEDEGDRLHLQAGRGEANPYSQREMFTAVKGLLDETVAYRAHFQRAEAKSLLSF